VLPKSSVGQALQYVLPRWDGLVRYPTRWARIQRLGGSHLNLNADVHLGSDNGGKSAAIL
jgi:hypothetical protein